MTDSGSLRAMFDAIPKVDAVARPTRFPGLRGWGRRRFVVLTLALAALFVLYGGLSASGVAAGLLLGLGAGLGAFVVASYVPWPGERLDLSPCGAMPLLWALGFTPWVLGGASGMSPAIAIGLLAVFALQRVAGVGCRT